MKTDRELLELAAKAAGHVVDAEISSDDWLYIGPDINGDQEPWNPLRCDGDAFRLAVKLNLHLVPLSFLTDEHSVRVGVADWDGVSERAGGDPYAATRRAIVRAAAAIGEQQ